MNFLRSFTTRAQSAPAKFKSSSPLPTLRENPPPFDAGYVAPRLGGADGTVTFAQAAHHPRYALIGARGMSKTSALQFLANQNAAARLLSLDDFHPNAPNGVPRDFENVAWILLDDYTIKFFAYAAELTVQFPNAQIVLAAREREGIPENFVALELTELNDREIYSFASVWFPSNAHGHGGLKLRNRAAEKFADAIKSNPDARTLATNPLNLFLLLQIFDTLERSSTALRSAQEASPEQSGTKIMVRFPGTRTELFDAYVRAVLKKESDAEFALRALEGIALSTKRGQRAQDDHLARGYGFLAERPSGRIAFVHELVQDFLAARALRLNPDFAPLKEHLDDPAWREVVLFYAGLGEASELVNTLRERDLCLAAQALAQWRTAPAELRKSIANDLIQRAWEANDRRALFALGQLRSNEAVDFFSAKLKDKQADVRARAAEALGYLDNDRALEVLLPQLRDADAHVRVKVVGALGMSKSERVLEPLLVALRGDARVMKIDNALRVAAAHALGHIGNEKAVPALIVDLQLGDDQVRAAVADALIQIRSEYAVRPLQYLAAKFPKPEVRDAAEKILATVTDAYPT